VSTSIRVDANGGSMGPPPRTRAPIRVLAVMDAYRVTGPARQLLAAATPRPSFPVVTSLALFQRTADPTPILASAARAAVPAYAVRDRFPGDPRTAVALARLVDDVRPDILQTHGYKANVLGRLIAPRRRCPWISFLHGDTWENAKVRAYFALERLAVRRADRIVVVAQEMAERLRAAGLPGARLRVVHNACVEEPVFDGGGMCSLAPVIGVIGRLSPEKGVDVALRVHQLVRRRFPEARLVVAGEGPEQRRLQQDAARLGLGASIEWLGYSDDVRELYRRLTVLILPSRSEGLPNVLLEAMAHGVPVVATAVGGVPEVAAHGRTGFLAAADDVEGLAALIERIVADPALRAELAARAREEVAARFSLDARLRALTAVYDEVLE
jgi:glycosyltransferase involved in cell wall biosynthesis